MRETAAAEIAPESIRAFRVQAHHLDRKLPAGAEEAAASVCGFQNSPPGAWETALWNRVEGCTLQAAQSALYAEKRLLQAWSVRGVPLVFPASESGVFLAPLAAAAGETPWIYTRGIAAALDFLGMAFDELLPLVLRAAEYLETHTVARKEALDAALAEIVEAALPAEKLPLWRAPSMYGPRQTVGGAVVSFLLRPCAFYSRVVFGARDGGSPTFTSYRRWTGRAMRPVDDAAAPLVRMFLRCYGPTRPDALAAWLGCSGAQARRLWASVEGELAPVTFGGKRAWVLAEDVERLAMPEPLERDVLLLAGHDPYLDQRDRVVLQSDKALQRRIWRTVANPGAIVHCGEVVGTWTGTKKGAGLEVEANWWSDAVDGRQVRALAEQHAAFRGLELTAFEG